MSTALAQPRLVPSAEWAELGPEEAPRRHVLRIARGPEGPLRLGDDDAALVRLLDGTRSVSDLIVAAEAAHGPDGALRLARIIAELGDRDLLVGITPAPAALRAPGRLARLATPRSRSFPYAPRFIAGLHDHGAGVLMTRPARLLATLIALGGLVGAALVLTSGTVAPFVVAGHIGLGTAMFVAARALLVCAHELAHGLALAHCGRTVDSAGMKLLLVFPYAYVDTSPVWLEPRRRRVAVTLAGPISDVVLGGAAALGALASGGATRDALFQLCIAAYLGALLNLNPMLDRDGYHLLVDRLNRPFLRREALRALTGRLYGRARSRRGSGRP